MKSDQVIDAVQTIGIITIAIVLSYVVVCGLEGTAQSLRRPAKKSASPPKRKR